MPKTSRSKKARIISSKVIYKGPAFYVTADIVKEPSGVQARRDIVHHSGSVVVPRGLKKLPSGPKVLLEESISPCRPAVPMGASCRAH